MQNKEPQGRMFALQIVRAQLIFASTFSILSVLLSTKIALAVLCGGMICVLANLWFSLIAFRPLLGVSAGQMLAAFYVAQAGKFIITASLFFMAFKRIELLKIPSNALFMFTAFLMVQSAVWSYPLVRRKVVASLAKINRR
jgi:ATP synthase protein I